MSCKKNHNLVGPADKNHTGKSCAYPDAKKHCYLLTNIKVYVLLFFKPLTVLLEEVHGKAHNLHFDLLSEVEFPEHTLLSPDPLHPLLSVELVLLCAGPEKLYTQLVQTHILDLVLLIQLLDEGVEGPYLLSIVHKVRGGDPLSKLWPDSLPGRPLWPPYPRVC